jgi:hypothetical protein
MDPWQQFLQQIDQVIKISIDVFSALSPVLTIIALVFIVGTKVRKAVREAKMSKEELWKDKMVRRLLSALGTGQIMDIIIILTELLNAVPAEDLAAMIVEFSKEYNLEVDMGEAMENLRMLLSIEKSVKTNPIFDMLKQHKEDGKQVVQIKNRKRWNRLRKEAEVDQALSGILSYYRKKKNKKVEKARKSGRVEEIEEKIGMLISEENRLRNRKMRHAIEKINEARRSKEEKEELDRIRKELHGIFSQP